MECKHDLVEREIAVTLDGMCPLCMKKKIEELEAKKKTWFEKMLDEQKGTPLFEAEGKILELEEENYKLKKKKEELEGKLVLHDKSQYVMVHKQFLKELEGRLEDQSARIGSLEDEVDHLRYKERREEE